MPEVDDSPISPGFELPGGSPTIGLNALVRNRRRNRPAPAPPPVEPVVPATPPIARAGPSEFDQLIGQATKLFEHHPEEERQGKLDQMQKSLEALGIRRAQIEAEAAKAPSEPAVTASGGPTAVPPNREQFIKTMLPHAQAVAKATGLDPRLVLAQAALETGYGTAAPGNNYFGIKSHGRSGGQTLSTTEAGPAGDYASRESFRTYADPAESANDYADFLKTNSRYKPVLAAQGLDAQIAAMGRSGYATDPRYAEKLRQIAQTMPAG